MSLPEVGIFQIRQLGIGSSLLQRRHGPNNQGAVGTRCIKRLRPLSCRRNGALHLSPAVDEADHGESGKIRIQAFIRPALPAYTHKDRNRERPCGRLADVGAGPRHKLHDTARIQSLDQSEIASQQDGQDL